MVQFLLINIQTSNEYFQKGDFSKTLALPFPPPNLSNQNLDIISHEKFTRYFAISYSKEKTTKYSTEKASENIYGNIESCFGSYFNWKCKLAGKNITIRYHGTIYVSNPDDVKILQDKQSLIYSIKTCNKYDAHIENTNYEYQIEYNKHNFTEYNDHSTLAEQNHQYNGYNDTYEDPTECNNHSTLAEQNHQYNGYNDTYEDPTECNNHSTLAEQNHQYNGYNDTYEDPTECNNHSTLAEQNHQYNGYNDTYDDATECNNHSTLIEQDYQYNGYNDTYEDPTECNNHSTLIEQDYQYNGYNDIYDDATECNNHSTLIEQDYQYNGYNDIYDDATECNNHSTLAEQKETPSSKCSIKDVFFCCFSKSTCIK